VHRLRDVEERSGASQVQAGRGNRTDRRRARRGLCGARAVSAVRHVAESDRQRRAGAGVSATSREARTGRAFCARAEEAAAELSARHRGRHQPEHGRPSGRAESVADVSVPSDFAFSRARAGRWQRGVDRGCAADAKPRSGERKTGRHHHAGARRRIAGGSLGIQ